MNNYPSPHDIHRILKAEQKSNKEIEKLLEGEREKFNRAITLLLLGPGEAGKSTVAKQLRLIHTGSWDHNERLEYKEIIINNIVKSIREVIEAMTEFGYKLSKENESIVSQLHQMETLNSKWAELYSVLLKDKAIEQTLNRSSEFLLKESAPYYFSELKRIASPEYIPSDADILRSRQKNHSSHRNLF